MMKMKSVPEELRPEYRSYNSAKNRCTNPNNAAYKNYGGRGIEFRFRSFDEFLRCLGRRPTLEYTLDRYPDNNGHYEVGNVRWCTRKEQAQNRRPYPERRHMLSDWKD